MKISKLTVLFIFMFIATSLFSSKSAFAEFSQDDLTGEWKGHILTSGSEESWEYNTVTIDSQGNVSVTYTNSAGETNTENDAAVISITSTGIISEATSTSLHGIMSPDKKMVVFTETWDAGTTYALTILIKPGETYSQSDIAGTWYGHTLTSGDEETWEYSTYTVSGSGGATIGKTDASGTVVPPYLATILSVAGDGTITSVPADPNDPADLHGIMSPDKNMVVFTKSRGLTGGTYALTVLTRDSGSFSLSDLQGKWQEHSLTSAAAGNWQGWERSTITVDAYGAFTLQSIASDNDTDTVSGTLAISSDGIITRNGTTLHGVLNLAKDIAVMTQTDETSDEYTLMVLVKETDTAAFSATPLIGKKPLEVAFTDSSSGDISSWSWSFGDGSTSTEQNPSHTYTNPGKYTVSLTVTGSSGSDVDTKTDYISVQGNAMSWMPILLDE